MMTDRGYENAVMAWLSGENIFGWKSGNSKGGEVCSPAEVVYETSMTDPWDDGIFIYLDEWLKLMVNV